MKYKVSFDVHFENETIRKRNIEIFLEIEKEDKDFDFCLRNKIACYWFADRDNVKILKALEIRKFNRIKNNLIKAKFKIRGD